MPGRIVGQRSSRGWIKGRARMADARRRVFRHLRQTAFPNTYRGAGHKRASFKHHAHVILAANFALTMFARKSEVNSCLSLRLAGSEGESPNMKSIHRSILTRALTAGVASLTLAMVCAGGVRAADSDSTDTEVGATGALGFGDGFGDIPAGPGQPATANAAAGSATGNATATATATGGEGGTSIGENDDSPGGDAFATSTAKTTGFGDATSTANATGGIFGFGGGGGLQGRGGNATAAADASATGGGKAIATAVALEGMSNGGFTTVFNPIAANATSSAETTNGAMAEAVSTTSGEIGEAQATAKTSLGGMSVQSTDMAPS